MKKLFVATLKSTLQATVLLSAASFAHADYRVVAGDNTPDTQLCVAALTSKAALSTAAHAAGLRASDLDTVRCNGYTLSRLAAKYGRHPEQQTAVQQATQQADKPVRAGFVFDTLDEKPETQLCLAAVTSSNEFEKVKEQHFSDIADVESEVYCNGLPLKRFALKYLGDERVVSQR